MYRLPGILLSLLGLVVAVGLMVAATRSPGDQGPVYAIVQVQAGLADHPRAWVGRTVRLRGVAWPCLAWETGPCLGSVTWPCPGWETGPCQGGSPILTDPGADAGIALALQRTDPLLAFVRDVPLVGKLVPPGPAPRWGVLASYRVQIRGVPITSCVYWPCYEAVLVGATLDTPQDG
jgi:hypothetical protein